MLKEGKCLYARDLRAKIEHESRWETLYLDAEPLRREHFEALRKRLENGSFGDREGEVLARSELARKTPVIAVQPFEVRLGGKTFKVKAGRAVSGIIKDTEGRAYRFGHVLYPVRDLGEENGKRIDVLFGAVILEDWGAVIDESSIPPKVDYYRLRKGELTEL